MKNKHRITKLKKEKEIGNKFKTDNYQKMSVNGKTQILHADLELQV